MFLLVLSAKYRFLISLQKEGRLNPALSVILFSAKITSISSCNWGDCGLLLILDSPVALKLSSKLFSERSETPDFASYIMVSRTGRVYDDSLIVKVYGVLLFSDGT